MSLHDYEAAFGLQKRDGGGKVKTEKLGIRFQKVVTHLESSGRIDRQLKRAAATVCGRDGYMSGSIMTFNQYVHNPTVRPTGEVIRHDWGLLEPIMLALWGAVAARTAAAPSGTAE